MFLALREEYRIRVFQNVVLRKIFEGLDNRRMEKTT